MNENRPPSGIRIEQAMATWMSARQRLLEDDFSLEHDEAALSEILGPVEGDVNDILARVLRAKVHAEAMAKAASEQADLIMARKRRYLAREDAMKGLAFTLMETLNKRKVELGYLTASIVAGPAGVFITDLAKVPDIYVEVIPEERKPDKLVMLADLKAGKTIEGAELGNGLDYLMIRKG